MIPRHLQLQFAAEFSLAITALLERALDFDQLAMIVRVPPANQGQHIEARRES